MKDNSSSGILLQWKVWLAKKNPVRALSVAVLIMICAYFVLFTTEDLLLTSIAAAVLVIMVIPYYLPITFILTDDGIIKKLPFSKKTRRWDEFHRFASDKNMIKLYTMEKPSRLDNYRSFLLICNKNKEDVLQIVKKKTADPGIISEP